MVRFERSKNRKDRKRSMGRGKRDGREFRGNFEDRPRKRESRGRLEMTKVTCSKCGERCEVPFKPKSDKPLFCSDCFEKNENNNRRSTGRSGRSPNNGLSERNLDVINEKLNKIMKALKID
ncbi:hypothetical protein GF336_01250 [Candidatus Woesearchaeota archaeon]|nr:hypothetical protein [Candidatus Woesearchaeota archaeon]